ncbi:hypothetical protein ACFYKX_20420 [Cytobacillus sp. FJAT-54145]|uniref:Oxalate:formate antiporter n=1 Tax=Cytobacillus spartinae TaxID=3299023 RepID=A0ABW6KJT1_9BACI
MNNNGVRDLIYVYFNENDQYVLSYGIEFAEFASALSDLFNNILLLKHQFDGGDFNIHTLLEYVPNDRLNKLFEEPVYNYGDFCWVDFEEIDGVDELPPQTLAELLYLGHIKDHLKTPFYNHLRNRFVYLAHDDGWWNKVYYRNTMDFYRMLGDVLADKLSDLKPEKNLIGLRKKKAYPSVNKDVLLNLKTLMKEGILLSLKDVEQSRARIEIPIWVIGDFNNMDDMYEEYERIAKQKCDIKIVFDKKTKEWKAYSSL